MIDATSFLKDWSECQCAAPRFSFGILVDVGDHRDFRMIRPACSQWERIADALRKCNVIILSQAPRAKHGEPVFVEVQQKVLQVLVGDRGWVDVFDLDA